MVLAVKPQMMDGAIAGYARFARPETLFLSIAAGKAQWVEVKLSSDGRRAVKGHRSLKAYAIATFSNGATATSPITLRR